MFTNHPYGVNRPRSESPATIGAISADAVHAPVFVPMSATAATFVPRASTPTDKNNEAPQQGVMASVFP